MIDFSSHAQKGYTLPDYEEMPIGAIVVAFPVLVYSIICLTLGLLLFLMQYYHSERWGYVALMALSVVLSMSVNICQQFWYIFHWRHDRTSEFEQAKHSLETPSLTIGPLTKGPSLVFFWIQMGLHNVTALLMCCWSIALVRGVYNLRPLEHLAKYPYLVPASKIASLLLSAICIGVPFAPFFADKPKAFLVISSGPMLICWAVGSTCVVTILVKYVHGMHSFGKVSNTKSVDISLQGTNGTSTSKGPVDKWLLMRFIVLFICLSTWELLIFNSALTRHAATVQIASQTEPDYSVGSTISSVLMFIPGATAGLTAFLIFGTIAPFRKVYRESMRECCSCCCLHKKRRARSNSEDFESGRGWRTLGAGSGRSPTYHCRVESISLGKIDLVGSGNGKKDGVVREFTVPKSPDRLEQPWRTLGVTPIQK